MALIVELARKFGRYGMTALNVLERLTALLTEYRPVSGGHLTRPVGAG